MIVEICGLPKTSTGGCRAHMRFWTYDSQANKCVFFTYGGCGRNGNSFNSEEAFCGLPPAANGLCLARFRRWSYDSQYNVCFPFTYGGCQGNENSFETQEECMAKCVE
ncbi:GM18129 [Drosophila sechellia]|uniref:GM18129 n=1 Tax=Drosophila sechellia TaxID=7238 RepID=B4I319_DROSE|nr:GM18129 [Drosophila sechellia]